jgi:tetratricopeptide (TPR) repeat protein
VRNNLGLALMRDGRLEESAAMLEEAVAEEPSSAAFVNLGNARRHLGDKTAALAAYRRALELDPDAAPALFNMHAVLYDEAHPEGAMDVLERALTLRPDHFDTRFYLGALRKLHRGDGGLVDALPEVCDFLVTSLRYVEEVRREDTKLFADTFDTLRFALSEAPDGGAVVELGVRRGTTLRFLAELAAPSEIHGFDAFEGLPQAWGGQPAGLYTTGGELPDVPPNATIHPGWFAETVPAFAQRGDALRLVHVDCDIYASTRDALGALRTQLVPGTVVVFDEYLCNPGWEREEHRAWSELGLRYDYLAFSLFTKQAVVVVR